MLGIDLRREAVLEKDPGLEIGESQNKVELVNYENNKIFLKTRNSQAGLLVLTDSFDSGWEVSIDKKKSEIFRADYNLRAVAVSGGEHEIEFLYEPKSFKIGLRISLLSLGLFLGLNGWVLTKRRNWW